MEQVEQILLEVKSAFKVAPPNGDILGWDRERYYKDFARLAEICKVSNDTDFNYSFCNSYNAEFKTNKDSYIYVVTVKISFITNVYSIHVTQYSRDKKSGKVVSVYPHLELTLLIKKITSYLLGKGFMALKAEWADLKVNGVSLELSEEATLGKCLFDDFED